MSVTRFEFNPRALETVLRQTQGPSNKLAPAYLKQQPITFIDLSSATIENTTAVHKMFSLRSALPRAGARAFSTTTPRSLAKMQLIGRLADTPAVNPTSVGRDVIKYAIGVSTGTKDADGNRGVSWFRVSSFSEGPQRDLLLSLPKG